MVAKVRPCLVLSVPPDPQDRALVTLVPNELAAIEESVTRWLGL
jgi:hypothetical protein